ncbi:GntR family transcriptional regulator [Actinocorallia herbida]|uniref:GntR family transcriptional regulator n=1 Tax=Actinocorallia herbida TaxID=58109 RepID=UPI001FE4299C|nr:GntR family transcriptional regulator [Actinocorallia herbida]
MTSALDLNDARRLRSDRARQVADLLRCQIQRGAFESGVLPKEERIVAEFGTTRNAVRDALDLLRAEGLVERLPGVGTLVTAVKVPHGLHRLLGLNETLHEHGDIVNELRAGGRITPPAAISARLGLPEGEPVVYIERLRRLGGVPLSLDQTYLEPELGTSLLAQDLEHEDVFVLIERLSGPLGRADLTIEAVNADPHSAAVLEAPRGAALLLAERLTHLADGRPVDLEFIRFRGDRLTMRGTLHRSL